MLRKMIVLLIALLFVAEGILPAVAVAGKDDGKKMRVTATSLNVRSGPGTQNAVVASVPKDGVVTVLEEQGEWCRVRLSDGREGWAAAKYLEPAGDEKVPEKTEPQRREEPRTEAPRVEKAEKPSGGGGSAFGSILKWGSLAGAVVCGGLAYSEKSKGDDTYEEYKDFYNAGKLDEAEEKWSETGDHDDKAQMYAIVGGGLFGLFLLQQFVLGGGDDDQTGAAPARDLPLAWDPRSGEVRLGVTLARF